MRHILRIGALGALLALASPAWPADCYADYKAKQDDPLRLHYGVMQLQGACQKGPARSEVEARLAANGWTLLNVLSVFGADQLQERRANAGSYFLRF